MPDEEWMIVLPDPHDAHYRNIESFDSEAEAKAFVVEKLGGEEDGTIGVISHIPDEGWLVDLPDPENPEGPWLFIESFDRKKDAIKFVRDKYGGKNGRLRVIWNAFDMEEIGPREWSPRWKRGKR